MRSFLSHLSSDHLHCAFAINMEVDHLTEEYLNEINFKELAISNIYLEY